MENWKQVVGYEGFYEVSDAGVIKGVNRVIVGRWGEQRRPERVLAIHRDGHGYAHVVLCRDGRSKTTKVHRIVLEAFVGPKDDKVEACHKNGIRTDNRLCNLRWGTKSSNSDDRVKHGTAPVGENNPKSKLTNRQVMEIYDQTKLGQVYGVIADRYDVSEATVSHIACGRTWSHLTGHELVRARETVTSDLALTISTLRGGGMTLNEIAERLDISRSTAFRHGRGATERGY